MIIFLYGADTFRSREKLQELKDKFIKEIDASGINLQMLDAKTSSIEAIENALTTSAFLVKKRMVILEHLLSTKTHEKNLERIVTLLKKKSSQDAITILWEEEIDPRKMKKNPLFLMLEKEKYVYSFDPLSTKDLYAWILKRTLGLGGNIKNDASVYLGDMLGNDLWRVDSEIQKLVSYKKNSDISIGDIAIMTSVEIEENIFLLTDALGNKDKKTAIGLVRGFTKAGMSELELLHKFLWQTRNLILVKSLTESSSGSHDPYAISQKCNLHPFVVKKILQQNNNFTIEELKKMHQNLILLDKKIKTGQKNIEAFFDLFILEKFI